MEEQLYHLWSTMRDENGALLVISIVIGFPLVALYFYGVYRWRIHWVMAWFVFSLVLFGCSQIFQENRTQWLQLAIGAPIGSGVLTWWIFRAFRKHDAKLRSQQSRQTEEACRRSVSRANCCPICGASLPANIKICPRCSAPLWPLLFDGRTSHYMVRVEGETLDQTLARLVRPFDPKLADALLRHDTSDTDEFDREEIFYEAVDVLTSRQC